MTHSIKIRKQYGWMIWMSWGWTRIFAVLGIGLLMIYFVLLFQVNSIASSIQNIEGSTRLVQRESTEVQTKIYTITRDVTFLELTSISQLELREPRDLAILYMQLPENTLVMR